MNVEIKVKWDNNFLKVTGLNNKYTLIATIYHVPTCQVLLFKIREKIDSGISSFQASIYIICFTQIYHIIMISFICQISTVCQELYISYFT